MRVAKECQIYIPTSLRLHKEAMIRYVKKAVCQLLDGTIPHNWDWIHYLHEVRMIYCALPSEENLFFIPAPFDATKCVNEETTYLDKVNTLTLAFQFSVTDLLEIRPVTESWLGQRKAVAYGTKDVYRIYSLEELMSAWNSYCDFVHPENNKISFTHDEVEALMQLLKQEYTFSLYTQVAHTVKSTRSVIRRMVRKATTKFFTLPPGEAQAICVYLKWLITAGLMMRGWKGSVSQVNGRNVYPLTSRNSELSEGLSSSDQGLDLDSRIDAERNQREQFISYCLVQLQKIWMEMNLVVRDFVQDLPSVIWKATKQGLRGSPEEEEEEDESENDSWSDEELQNDSKMETEVNRPNILGNFVALEFGNSNSSIMNVKPPNHVKQQKEKDEKESEFERWNKLPLEVKSCTPSFFTSKVKTRNFRLLPLKKGLPYLLHEVITSVACYREASRPLIQGGCFWLETLFHFEPLFPVYCIESIE